MLYIDKYNVNNMNDVKFNANAYNTVKTIATNSLIPHLIISGEHGCGKKSLANFYIREKYNIDHIKTNMKPIEFKYSNKKIKFNIIYSIYHYLIDPSKHGVYDKQIIQYTLNDILKYRPINKINYHIIIIDNADRLTIESQQSLRRTLEKFVENCRFIFLSNNNNSMIEPIRSRCITIKLNLPSNKEIFNILENICQNEHIEYSPLALNKIISNNQNLKHCINNLQLLTTQKIDIKNVTNVFNFLHDNDKCSLITRLLIQNINLNINISDLVIEIRKIIQSMLTECYDPIWIVKRIFNYFYNHLNNTNNNSIIPELIKITNQRIYELKNCNKPIYSIEGLCLNIYSAIYQSTITTNTPK